MQAVGNATLQFDPVEERFVGNETANRFLRPDALCPRAPPCPPDVACPARRRDRARGAPVAGAIGHRSPVDAHYSVANF